MRINQNPITLSDLKLPRYAPTTPKGFHKREVVGFDTETLNGYCRLITDSTGRSLYADSLDPILRFLTFKSYRTALNVFFNIRYDFQAIIKYLPREQLEELHQDGETKTGRYRLKYIPKKLFNITVDKHTYTFYDIAQFYHTSLENVGHKYLGLEKYINEIDRVRLGTEADYWNGKQSKIAQYCINDSLITQRAGKLLQDSVRDIIGMYPKRWTSQATISKYYFRYYSDIPRIHKIPKAVLNMALKSYSGGRFETIKKGFLPNGYNIDINSAYPFQIQNLADITKGEWKRIKQPSEKALYGFYAAKVHVPLIPIAPLPFRSISGLIVYPVGDFITHLTRKEYLAYRDLIDINILYGVEFYPSEIVKPFMGAINKVYAYKKETPKEDFRYSVSKIIMNALYGSFYEKHPTPKRLQAGILFNPIYASIITANTRVQLYEAIKGYEDKIISFATDGILLEEKPNIPYSRELGAWDIEPEADITIIKTGVYRYGNKSRSRGVKRIGKVKTPYGNYDSLWDYIEAQPTLKTYPIKSNRPIQLGEVLAFTKTFSPEDLNRFKDRIYNIDINKDSKRVWLDTFKSGSEVFKRVIGSLPITLD